MVDHTTMTTTMVMEEVATTKEETLRLISAIITFTNIRLTHMSINNTKKKWNNAIMIAAFQSSITIIMLVT